MQNFLPTTNTTPGYLAFNYLTPGTSLGFNEVRNDKEVDFSVQPVLQNDAGLPNPFVPDYESGDAFSMALGNFDEPPTAGVFSLQVGATTSGLADLAYNISASALQAALNAALATEAKPLCTVILAASGAYVITGATNGAITDGFFAVLSDTGLYPISNAFFTKGSNGSVSTPYIYTFTMRQAPMCYAEPTVELDAADVSIATIQAGSATVNKIQQISFNVSQVSAGSYTINGTTTGADDETCGTASPLMSARQLGLILAQHSAINYSTPDEEDNIAVEALPNQRWNITFIGNLKNSDAPELTVENIDLVGPAGLSGSINYNTFGLYVYSLSQADTFTLTRQIQRTRGGETRTLYSGEVTIYKDLIDASTAVPTPTIAYYTAVQSDARFLKKITPGDALPSGYTLAIESGADVDFEAGSALTVDGTIDGAPTGGTLDLSDVTLTLPDSSKLLVTNPQSGTSYTLALSDLGKLILMSNGSANDLEVPLNATVALPVGFQCAVMQDGAGITTFVPESGSVTIDSAGGLLDISAQYASAALVKTATNTWKLVGSLA